MSTMSDQKIQRTDADVGDSSSKTQKINAWFQNSDDVYDKTRSDDELRPTTQINNTLTRADGSVEIQHGATLLLCTVNGPMVAERGRQLEDSAYIELNLHLVPAQPSTVAHRLMLSLYHQETYDTYLKRHLMELARYVIDTSLYPRQKIVVSFEIISFDGSLFTICANALMQAVFNSGVAARSTYLSFTMAKILHNGNTIYKFDPTLADEAYATGLITMTIENPKFVHNFETGESVEQTTHIMNILKSLYSSPTPESNEDDDQPKQDPYDKYKNKYTVDQVKEMKRVVEEEPQIVQLLTQKEWIPAEMQHAMGLIVEKWIVLAAQMRE